LRCDTIRLPDLNNSLKMLRELDGESVERQVQDCESLGGWLVLREARKMGRRSKKKELNHTKDSGRGRDGSSSQQLQQKEERQILTRDETGAFERVVVVPIITQSSSSSSFSFSSPPMAYFYFTTLNLWE